MKKRRNANTEKFAIGFAFGMMAILFISSSMSYEAQDATSFLTKMLYNKPFKEELKQISFVYADSEVSIASSNYFKFIEFFIRKGAHFVSYFLIGGALIIGLKRRMENQFLTLMICWLAATGYAGLDEFHQMLTSGRTPLFQDVFLDSLGALTGSLVVVLIMTIKSKKNRNSE